MPQEQRTSVRVHIAGLALHIEGRLIQRCACCGEKLIDTKNQLAPIKADGSSPDRPRSYVELALVRTEYTGPAICYSVIDPKICPDGSKKIPEDFCLEFSDHMESL